MADAITIKALQDASVDAKSLEEVVNGNDAKQVTTRLGETYPSVKKAIKTLFENGGLPATPFATKALMTASALVDGKYAQVTDDTVNNGLYVKTAGVWVKSTYSPITKANDNTDYFNASVLTRDNYVIGSNGGYISLSGSKSSRGIPMKQGDVATITTRVAQSGDVVGGFYRLEGAAVNFITFADEGSNDLQTFEYVAPYDGGMKVNCFGDTTGFEVIVNKGQKIYAEAVKTVVYDDFEFGYADAEGSLIETNLKARTGVYKIPSGTRINFERFGTDLWFGMGSSSTPNNVPITDFKYVWMNERSTFKIVPDGHNYVRFYAQERDGNPFDLAEVKKIRIMARINALYADSDIGDGDDDDVEVTPSTSFSLYRTPSLAAGGMVSIIDDDGRDSVATKLYPFMKDNNAPFGTAINANRIGKTGTFVGGGSTMTLEQLKAIAADTDIVEVMSHGFGHVSMAAVSQKEREYELWQSGKWFLKNGFDVSGYVFPYGNDNAVSRATVQKYYQSAYDYTGAVRVETFDTIINNLISRTAWNLRATNLASHKALVDEVVAKNGWLVICTHVDSDAYWNENSFNELQELIDYIKSKDIPIVRPKDGFQTFGNIVENDGGFKIQADGKIVGAT